MKTLATTVIILLLHAVSCYGQEIKLDMSLFRLNGLEFYSAKEAIISKYGKPGKVTEPNYECGFYSEREQGNKYYQLHYGPVVFIGNDQENYAIESIEFDADGKQTLEYGKWKLSGKTTTEDYLKIFGKAALDDAVEYTGGETGVTLFPERADNGIMFFFKSGRLVRVEEYTPC